MRFPALYFTNVQLESIACFAVALMTTPLQQGLSSPHSDDTSLLTDEQVSTSSSQESDIASAECGGHHIAAATYMHTAARQRAEFEIIAALSI
eukprot:18127-Heterococcus_DN1.PRE.3